MAPEHEVIPNNRKYKNDEGSKKIQISDFILL